MARLLAENERLLHCATMGLRAPDGTVIESVPLYQIITVEEIGRKGLTETEENACLDFARDIAPKFKSCFDQMRALGG